MRQDFADAVWFSEKIWGEGGFGHLPGSPPHPPPPLTRKDKISFVDFHFFKVGRRKYLIGGLVTLTVVNTLMMLLLFYFKWTGDLNTGYVFIVVLMIFHFTFKYGDLSQGCSKDLVS